MNVIVYYWRMHYSTLDSTIEVESMSTHVEGEGGGGIPYLHVTLNHTEQICSVELYWTHFHGKSITVFLRVTSVLKKCYVIWEHLQH